jgi:hypothetical protein
VVDDLLLQDGLFEIEGEEKRRRRRRFRQAEREVVVGACEGKGRVMYVCKYMGSYLILCRSCSGWGSRP